MTLSPALSLDFRAIAPDYEATALTIRDKYQFESLWVLAGDAGQAEVEECMRRHLRLSAGCTRRN